MPKHKVWVCHYFLLVFLVSPLTFKNLDISLVNTSGFLSHHYLSVGLLWQHEFILFLSHWINHVFQWHTYIVFQFKVRICITKSTAISLMVPTCSRPITEVKLGEPSQYWDGLPPWKTGCCWQSTVLQLLTKLVDYVNDTQFTINQGFSKKKRWR